MDKNSHSNFRIKVWSEIEPIAIHAVVVIVLELSLLIIGLITLGLEKVFPKQVYYFSIIEIIDIWLALVLLCLFGLYTFISISLRLYKGIAVQYKEK